MKPWKENGGAISSEEVNFLVFRYLQESGENFLFPADFTGTFFVCCAICRIT